MPKIEPFDFKQTALDLKSKQKQMYEIDKDIQAIDRKQSQFIYDLQRELKYWVEEFDFPKMRFDDNGDVYFYVEMGQGVELAQSAKELHFPILNNLGLHTKVGWLELNEHRVTIPVSDLLILLEQKRLVEHA